MGQPPSLTRCHQRQVTWLDDIQGLVWRDGGCQIHVNPDRPFIRNLDDLPIPMHHLLPWDKYRAPSIKGPYTFIVPSRGCPAGCKFCIKHVSYQYAVRIRSPENILEELKVLWDLGLRNVNMYADLFTVNRDQVMGICEGMIREGLDFRWTCNSRVDYVDPEMLQMMREGRLLADRLGHRKRPRADPQGSAQGHDKREDRAGAPMEQRSRHHELGLLYRRPAG